MRVVHLECCPLRSGPCPRKRQLFLGWINGHHHCRGTASNNLLCESAVTTADIKPSKSLWQFEPVEKRLAYTTAPTAHHALIGFSVGESTHENSPSFAVCADFTLDGSCPLWVRSGHPDYSITSSARPISVLGTLRPSAFAVFRLTTSSTFVTCWTGRSAGLSPLRTRPV